MPTYSSTADKSRYVDRLLASEIVAIAQTYLAGGIVLPKLGDMREQGNTNSLKYRYR